MVANGNKPRIVDMVGVSKAEDLEKKLKPALKVDVSKISTLKSWSSSCTSRRACVVVGHKWPAQKDAAVTLLRPLLERHRAVKVVTLDTSFWQLKLDDAVMATRPAKEKGQKSADILCLARKEGNLSANETHVGRFLDSLDASSAGSLLAACAKQEGLVPIGVAPRIKTRPSKPAKVVTPEPWRPSASPTPTAPGRGWRRRTRRSSRPWRRTRATRPRRAPRTGRRRRPTTTGPRSSCEPRGGAPFFPLSSLVFPL